MLQSDIQSTPNSPAQRNDTTKQQVMRFLGQATVELGGSKNTLGIFLEHSEPLIFQNVIVYPVSPENKSPLGEQSIRDLCSSAMKFRLCSKKGL